MKIYEAIEERAAKTSAVVEEGGLRTSEAVEEVPLRTSEVIKELENGHRNYLISAFERAFLGGSDNRRIRKSIIKIMLRRPKFLGNVAHAVALDPSFAELIQLETERLGQGLISKFTHFAWRKRYILLAFAAFSVVLSMPTPAGLSVMGHRALAVFVLTITLWVTEAVPLAVTSILCCVMCSILGIVEPKEAFAGFGSPTVYFLIGALLLGVAVMKVNLHKRISLVILDKFISSPAKMVFGVCILGATLSMLMPEHGVVAMLFPVLLAIIAATGVDTANSNFSKNLLLALAYGCSVGSLGTLLGGARNPLAIAMYKDFTNESITFLGWMVAAFPIVIIMIGFVFIILKKIYPIEEIDLRAAHRYMRRRVRKLGRVSPAEKRVMGIFIAAFLSWAILGHIVGLAVIAMAVAVTLFLTKSISWEDAEKKLPWSIIFLYGGAITIAKVLSDTGAASFLANKTIGIVGNNPYITILIIIVIVKILTELMSNAAATAIVLPIALTTMVNLGYPPMVAVFVVALSSGLAFMLPISTPGNAIVYSSGFISIRDLIRAGSWLDIIGIVVFMTVGLAYWKLIGIF